MTVAVRLHATSWRLRGLRQGHREPGGTDRRQVCRGRRPGVNHL